MIQVSAVAFLVTCEDSRVLFILHITHNLHEKGLQTENSKTLQRQTKMMLHKGRKGKEGRNTERKNSVSKTLLQEKQETELQNSAAIICCKAKLLNLLLYSLMFISTLA